MSYDIEWINDTPRSVDYSAAAVADYDAGQGDGIEKYTLLFESQHARQLQGGAGDDIGGLIVYTSGSNVVAVYDYENFCGWLA